MNVEDWNEWDPEITTTLNESTCTDITLGLLSGHQVDPGDGRGHRDDTPKVAPKMADTSESTPAISSDGKRCGNSPCSIKMGQTDWFG